MKSGVKFFFFLLLPLTILYSACVENTDLMFEEEGVIIEDAKDRDGDNAEHNRWIYAQMKHDYFWNTEMPDSSSLDFTVKPTEFFEGILSVKDRFSWCEINLNYSRGTNVNSTVSLDSVYLLNDKRIGYAIYDEFGDYADVRGFAVRMKNAKIEELILDLRYNSGGYVNTCNELASFFVPTKYLGALFQQQRHNEILRKEKIEKNGGLGIDSVYLRSGDWFNRWGLNLSRLIVLTTERTASASEALIYGLRPYMEVITIGSKTCGKDVGSYTIANDSYKYQLQPITFRYYNALKDSIPITGIVPDVYVENDPNYKRGEIDEPLLKTAIEYLLSSN